MTDKQWACIREYTQQGFVNIAGAYRHAYTNCKSEKAARSCGSRLLTNANVREYLEEVKARAGEDVQVDANYVLKGLKKEAEREGEGSTQSARVRAIELLGKHQGMFTDKRAEEHGGEPEAEAPMTRKEIADLWEGIKRIKTIERLEKMLVAAAKKQAARSKR
jgi:phage terminase small subunit